MNEVRVMREEWDYLIILDACRYDYFEQVWQDYLQGRLEKRRSVGTGTTEWRNKSFPDYYDDVIYISANPFINSLTRVKHFSAKEHFAEVYDLWLTDWDKEQGTVLPEVVTQKAIEIVSASPDKRAIIHYIQPHEPYLGSIVTGPGFEPPTAAGFQQGVNQGQPPYWAIRKIMKILSGVFYWLGLRGNFFIWNLREFLGVPPAGPMDAVRREYGKEGLRKAYKGNLEIVLRHAAELVEDLSGRIVITADHGEMLGEGGCYCHWGRAGNKFLREIPWLIIDKGKKAAAPKGKTTVKEERKPQRSEAAEKELDGETERQIQERLRALGYFD